MYFSSYNWGWGVGLGGGGVVSMATGFQQKRSMLEADRKKAQEDYWGFNVESNHFNSLL